jgi:hypothetical protein
VEFGVPHVIAINAVDSIEDDKQHTSQGIITLSKIVLL